MYTINTIALLALAGSAVAAPRWGGSWGGNNGNSNADVQTDVAMVTAYTTVYANGNWNGHQAQATATAQAQQHQEASVTQEAQQPEETASSASQNWGAWSSSAAASPVATAGSSSGSGYMSIVSEWRSKMGMSALTEDSTLAANALKTAVDGKGKMVHELNPGSMAQVLAPGDESNFESCFVGGWLCEIPSLPGLDGVCSTESNGWTYDTTGHADILTSTSYSKIGCGWNDNIWACDLA